MCMSLCLSCLQLCCSPFYSYKSQCKPTLRWSEQASPCYSFSLSCARFNLTTVSPFRDSKGISCVHSSLVIYFILVLPFSVSPSVPILPNFPFLSKAFRMVLVRTNSFHVYLQQGLQITRHKTHFCSTKHCHSIIPCYHDMPLSNHQKK